MSLCNMLIVNFCRTIELIFNSGKSLTING